MNRFGAILALLLLSLPAFAQEGPRSLAGPTDTVDDSQAQLQKSVTQLYFSGLQNKLGLTDGQFLRSRQAIQNFIGMRFRNANQRKNLDERQEQILKQLNASEADIQKLNEDESKLAGEIATWETRLIRKLQNDLGADQQLSERQILALRTYNKEFFTERLPNLLEQVRAGNLPLKGQQRPPVARGNQNQRGQAAAPANTLRGRDVPPPVQPPRKLAR